VSLGVGALTVGYMAPPREGDPIADTEHVVRHLTTKDVDEGAGGEPVVGLTAFRLSAPETDSLSVYHVDPLGPVTETSTFVKLADMLAHAKRNGSRAGREVRDSHRFGTINCGEARTHVARNVVSVAALIVECQPRPLVDNHAGIRAQTDAATWEQVAIQLRAVCTITPQLQSLRTSS